MLFRPVCGPELEAIWAYVVECNRAGNAPGLSEIREAFIPRSVDGSAPSPQNVEDAVSFLRACALITQEHGYQAQEEDRAPFALRALRQLRRIEQSQDDTESPLNPLYLALLTELFVKPDLLFIADVHAAANELEAVKAAGGLSKEKTRAWQRVMEFFGLGRRIGSGFQCIFSPALLEAVLLTWDRESDTLQSFLENTVNAVLPYARADGDLARAFSLPLAYLEEQGKITLFPMQDSPTRGYFGARQIKGISKETQHVDAG